MIRVLAHFRVRKEALPQAVAAIEAFVDEVGRKEGGTASYRSLQHVDDPTRFTHFMEFRVASARQYHEGTPWAKRFMETLRPLCSEPPTFHEVRLVGKGP